MSNILIAVHDSANWHQAVAMHCVTFVFLQEHVWQRVRGDGSNVLGLPQSRTGQKPLDPVHL